MNKDYYRLDFNQRTHSFRLYPINQRQDENIGWEIIAMTICYDDAVKFIDLIKNKYPELVVNNKFNFKETYIKKMYNNFIGISEF